MHVQKDGVSLCHVNLWVPWMRLRENEEICCVLVYPPILKPVILVCPKPKFSLTFIKFVDNMLSWSLGLLSVGSVKLKLRVTEARPWAYSSGSRRKRNKVEIH